MGKYLTLFDTHQEYETYINGGGVTLPNVSHCIDTNDVHYNPLNYYHVIATLNVTDIEKPTIIQGYFINSSDQLSGKAFCSAILNRDTYEWTISDPCLFGIKIDGGQMISASDLQTYNDDRTDIDDKLFTYHFDSVGDHTIEYIFTDPETIRFIFTSLTVTSVDYIDDKIDVIVQETFYSCTSLTSIDIPNTVTVIGDYAFLRCIGLTSVTIGNSVTSIGQMAFSVCTSLESITCLATIPPTLGTNAFNNTNNCPIYVPAESVNAYKTTWSAYASRIQAIP